jgi:hypothetical protein
MKENEFRRRASQGMVEKVEGLQQQVTELLSKLHNSDKYKEDPSRYLYEQTSISSAFYYLFDAVEDYVDGKLNDDGFMERIERVETYIEQQRRELK